MPQCTMWSVRVVALAPTFHDHLCHVQRIEEFAVEQFIPQFSSVIPSFRQASTTEAHNPPSFSISLTRALRRHV